LAGSAALDAGDDAVCAAEPVNGVDQRGAIRPQGARCDIGAYERPSLAACTFPNLIAGDEASLRQAIDCLNVAPAGAYTLTIAADIVYTQLMFSIGNPAITNLLIAGNDYTLDAQGHGRVLRLDNVQNLLLRDLTLTGGKTDVNGGGLAFDCSDGLLCTWTLLNTVVQKNQASSGGGIDYFCSPGGGGALIVQDSVIDANQASTTGGGIHYHTDEDSGFCSVTLRNTLLEGNLAVDGGAIRISRPRVTIIDSTIRNNVATGLGGGLMARIGDGFIDMTMLNSTVSGNRAELNGGGLYIQSREQGFDIKLINSTVSSNTVTSGAGGGLYLHESNDSLRISLLNSTVTQNVASQGAGVHVFHQDASFEMTGTLRLTNSIVADNLGSDCAGNVAPGVIFTGQRVTSFGHNLDSDGTCLIADVLQPGDIANGNANLGPLADNGGPTLTHALLAGSAAIDAGDDAVCAAEPVNGADQRGVARPQGAHCDIGAYEAAGGGANLLFISSSSTASAGDVAFRDEDILAYDFSTNSWMMVFDGSDVGVTKDVDAFSFLADGDLLLSFNGATTVTGLGAVDDSDIVRFTPTALGSDTAGSFVWHLRGADVGLTSDGEDIDLVDFSADGHLVVSTIGDFNAPDAAGQDEDLFQLDNATFGNPSSGAWSLFFDASNGGLANEDLNGLWIDPASGELYLTVKDSFAFDDEEIDSDDIFICTPTETDGSITCAYELFWDSDEHDYGSENIDAIHLGALPLTFTAPVQASAEELTTPEEALADVDADDLDPEENEQQIFLPIVVRLLSTE
jgi:hypothetical protein